MTETNRTSAIKRKTKETDIELSLNLDGSGQVTATTGIGFFDHMLQAMAHNALFDMELSCTGDLEVDQHHTVEDVGIALGEALARALGDNRGIKRYGLAAIPMDETLVRCAMDLSGRAYLHFDLPWQPLVGVEGFEFPLAREFCWGLCRAASVTVHIETLSPGNNHHMCEAAFKALGRALCDCVLRDPRRAGLVPSTKGSL